MGLKASAALLAACALAWSTPHAAGDEPRDAYASAAELAGPAAGGETRDAFSSAAEYPSFAAADVPRDAWAALGDRAPYLPLPPPVPGGTIDDLAQPGDELERYERATGYAGGWGPGEKRCVILMYHRFRPVPANPFEVSYADFHAQMEYLSRNGYVVIPVEQLVEALNRQDPDLLPPHAVVITVDDGYRCVHDFAWPVLRRYNFPFAIYLYTNYIDNGGQTMTWEELRAMAADELVSIGAHSVSHANLANPKRARGNYALWLEHELTYPKRLLEEALGKPVTTFAWPYGSFNRYTLDAAVRAGYEGILTVAPGANSLETSPFMLHRYGVYWHTSLATFAMMLEGKPVGDEINYYALAREEAEEEFLIP